MQLYLAAKDSHICEVKKSENRARCIEDLGKIKKEKVIDELQPQIQKVCIDFFQKSPACPQPIVACEMLESVDIYLSTYYNQNSYLSDLLFKGSE